MAHEPLYRVKQAEGWLGRLLLEPDRARLLFPLLLLALTLIVWFPTLFYGLDLSNPDDYYHTTDAALRHSFKDISGWFIDGYWAYNHYEYRPLTRLSLLLTYLVWGPHTLGYHLTNVLLHFACAWLLGALLVTAGAAKWPARLAAVIWVVFPQTFMAVRWVNGRQDLQCAAFVLAAVWFFGKWLAGKPWGYAAGAAVCVVCAALTKEPGAITPAFLLVVAFTFPGRRPWPQKLAAVFVMGLLLVLYVFLRLRAWPMDSYNQLYAYQLRPLDFRLQGPFARELLAPALYPLFYVLPGLGGYLLVATNRDELICQQIAFWAGLAILLRWQPRLLLIGLAWKLIFFLPVYSLYWNNSFTHYRYLPTLGTAWLAGLVLWELGVWFCARARRWLRPAARWSVVALMFALTLRFYLVQMPLAWPPLADIAKGGPPPPEGFGKNIFTNTVGFSQTITAAPPDAAAFRRAGRTPPPQR